MTDCKYGIKGTKACYTSRIRREKSELVITISSDDDNFTKTYVSCLENPNQIIKEIGYDDKVGLCVRCFDAYATKDTLQEVVETEAGERAEKIKQSNNPELKERKPAQ